MRRFVTFQASGFLDEAEWTAKGDPLVPDGRSVLKAITDALSRNGFNVSEPTQHSFYGWSSELILPGCTAWFVLQGGEPWLLEVEEVSPSIFKKVFGSSHLPQVLKCLHNVLREDDRFVAIQWFTEKEYHSAEQTGHRVPFDDPDQ
jgi:hypothetical protein